MLWLSVLLPGFLLAQKNIQLTVYQVQTTIPDCDGWLNNSDPAWYWNTTGPGINNDQCYTTTCNGCTVNGLSEGLMDEDYDCLSDVPASVNVNFSGCEDDGVVTCLLGTTFTGSCDGSPGNRNDNITLNTTNGTYFLGPFTVTSTGCVGNFTYWLRMDVSGSFLSSPPANDNICNATQINIGATVAGSNACATVQSGEVDPSSGSISPSRTTWHFFIAPPSGHVIVTTDLGGTTFDTEIAIYHDAGATCPGNNWGNLTEEGANDDKVLLFNLKSEVELECLTPGDRYYIQIDGNDATDQGAYQCRVTSIGQPLGTNDLICNAINLGTLNFGGSLNNNAGSNLCFGTQAGEPNAGCFGEDATAWYRFTTGPVVGTEIVINGVSDPLNNGDDLDMQIAIYSSSNGLCTGTMTEAGCDFDSDLGFWSGEDLTVNCLEANTVYWVQIDGGSLNVEGYFGLTISDNGIAQPTNDDICNAISVGVLPFGGTISNNNGNNFCAGTQPGEPNSPNCIYSIDQTVWYTFTTGANVGYETTISAVSDPLNLGDDLDLQVSVLQSSNGLCTGTLSEIDCDYDPDVPLFWSGEDLVVKCLDPNTTYWIQLDGSAINVEGFLGISITDDGIARAPNDLVCNATSMGTVPNGGSVSVTNQNNYCADTTPGEPKPNSYSIEKTVWYTFKPPSSGSVILEAINSGSDDIDLQVAVWETSNDSCAGGFWSLIEDNDNPFGFGFTGTDAMRLTCLDTSKTYFIQVDGIDSVLFVTWLVEGIFDIVLTDYGISPAPNDSICDAIPLGDPTGGSVSITNQHNFCADNILEPIPTCFGTNKTVWYQFIAPSTGRVTVFGESDPNNTGDYIDIQLAVYGSSNDSCEGGTLVQMGCDYNDLLEWPPLSRDEELYVQCLIPGKPYWVMVDGSDDPDDVDGWFDLTITEEPGPVPITNDDICDAIYLGQVPGSGSIHKDSLHNFCATVQPGEPVPAAFGLDHTVWFTFRAPPSGNLTIGADTDPLNFGDDIDLQLAVYESSNDSCNGTFTEVESDYDIPLWDEDVTVTCLDPGRLYFIQVDGALWPLLTLEEGHFDLTLTEDPAFPAYPTNDSICNATNMGVVPGNGSTAVFNGSNFCATVENGEPGGVSGGNNFFDCLGDETVWFKFTTSGTPGGLTINLTNTQDGLIPSMNVYQATNNSSCSFNDLYMIDSTINFIPFINISSNIPCPSANTTYYVQVDGLDCIGDYGRFDIQVTDNGIPQSIPANDSICNAQPLGIVPSGGSTPLTPGDNTCAGEEAGEPNVPGGGSVFTNVFYDETVWYTFTTSATPGLITVDVTNTVFLDASIVVYQVDNFPSCNFNDLTEIDAATGLIFPLSGDAHLDLRCLDANTTYYIQLDGLDVTGDNGPFDIQVSDDGNPFTVAPYDSICNAANMGVVPAGGSTPVISTNNFCAKEEVNEPNVSGGSIVTDNNYDETVWFHFTTPANPGLTTIDIFNTVGINAWMTIYRANNFPSCNFNDLTYITEEDDLFSNDVSLSIACLPPNTTYYIQVDGVDGIGIDEGTFDIRVTDDGNANVYAPSDSICQALPLGICPSGGSTAVLSSNNFCAGEEPLEPLVSGLLDITLAAYDETVWYTFTTSATPGDITISCFNTVGIFASINVYSPGAGCALNALTYINGANPNIFTGDASVDLFCLQPNTTYYFQIDGDDVLGQNGTFDLQITDNGSPSPAPANDSICNAVFMGNPNGSSVGPVNGNNICATESPGEPGVNGDDETVWYSFVAPTSGQVEVDINSTSWVDINASLYHSNGGSCAFSALSQVGSNHDDFFSFSVDFTEDCLIPGDTYFVQIDGGDFLGDMGYFNITILDDDPFFTPPPNDGCGGAVNLAVQDESCQGTGLWNVFNYGTPTVSINDPFVQGCGDNCGDLWFSFTMPSTGSVLIEGNDEYGFLGLNNSAVTIAAYSGPCNNLTPIDCDQGGWFGDPFFYVNGTPGQTYYLQVFDDGGDDINEDFGLCVSDRCGQDSCQYAQVMQAGVPYCFDTDGASGESTPADPGYDECGDGSDPGNSVYFTFVNNCAYFNISIQAQIGGFCILGEPTDGLSWALFLDATPCDNNPDALVDCQQTDICLGGNWTFNKSYGPFPPGSNFVMQLDGFDFTGDDQGTIMWNESCVLEINLTRFEGWNEGAINLLEWETYDGWNVDEFVVEKSLDGNNFTDIGVVEGSEFLGGAQGGSASNSNDLYKYQFPDQAPVNGHNFYRLRKIDRNGDYTYTDVIDVYLNLTNQSEIVSIYPNPAQSQVNVDVFAGEDGEYVVEIVDLYGHVLIKGAEMLDQGLNTLTFNLNQFSQGLYIVHLHNRNNTFQSFGKFTKN
ncbi:MAG: T9SS type A sorting domain-containing protein [Bacteroidia bacterium]|nr:T9SS type A sorting domain-containing protein [Bacteroidia bacterium]